MFLLKKLDEINLMLKRLLQNQFVCIQYIIYLQDYTGKNRLGTGLEHFSSRKA